MAMAKNPNAAPFPRKFPMQPNRRPSTSLQPPPPAGSKILPLIRPNSNPRSRPTSPSPAEGASSAPFVSQRFPAAGAPPYVPVHQQYRMPYRGMAPPVTIRNAVPCFSAPSFQPPSGHHVPAVMGPQPIRMASPVRIRQVVPAFAASPSGPAPVVIRPAQAKEQLAPAELKEEALPAIVIPTVVKPATGEAQGNAEAKDVKEAVKKEGSEATDEKAAVPEVKREVKLAEEIVAADDVEESAAAIERLKQLQL